MTLGVIVMLFIGIIVAIALLVPIADTTGLMTKKQGTDNQSVSIVTSYINETAINESINYTIYDQSAWKILECPLTSVVIRNGAETALAVDVDYTLYASEGVYSLLNGTKLVPATSLNLTYVDYEFCADGYNTSAGSRSIAGLIVTFATLAIVAFVLVGIKNDWF